MGSMAANPNGRMIPAAIVAVKGVRFGHDAMYGFGGGPEEAPAVMVRVVLALAPAAGVIELGANWNVLQIRIGRRQSSRRCPGLPESSVQAATRKIQQGRQRIDVGRF